MNNARRKAISEIAGKLSTVKEEIESLMQDVEDIKSEEEEYRDNIPENMQGGEKYEAAENAVENLEEAYSCLDDIVGSLGSRKLSRRGYKLRRLLYGKY